MIKKLLLIITISSLNLHANPTDIVRLHSSSVLPHPSLGSVCISHNGSQFTVYHQGKATNVASYDVDPVLRHMPQNTMKAFLKHGLLKVNQYDNGDYTIKALVPGEAGGPGLANFGYFLIKGIGYTLPVVVTVTAFTQGVDVPPAFQFVGKVAGKYLNKKAVEVVTQGVVDTATNVGGKTAAKLGADISKQIVKEAGTKVSGELVGSLATSSGGYFAAVETVANAAYLVLLAVPGW